MKLKIDDSFYQEEERCGYLVSAKMKRIWAVELDLLYQLQQICEKYGIKYYASGGTILGAEGHKGMIPWDDDIDIMMLRDQYDLLCQHADEFEEPYFFQTYETDDGYFRGHAQLRNSNTTGVLVEEIEKNVPFNQGIFIDIFPLDYYPEDEEEQKRIDQCVHSMNRRISDFYYTFNTKQSLKRRVIGLFDHLMHPNVRATLLERDKIMKSVEESGLIINWGGAWGKKEIVPAEWYGDGIDAIFEI